MKVKVRVHVNDIMNPLERKLNREQVWQGLMQRVKDPLPFIPGLLRFEITNRKQNSLERFLHFSSMFIIEHVTWDELVQVSFETIGPETATQSLLNITFEQPDEIQLILVFSFNTQLAEKLSEGGQDYRTVITDAYTENARETVLTIRKMFENEIDSRFFANSSTSDSAS